jgi:hypothetical protein
MRGQRRVETVKDADATNSVALDPSIGAIEIKLTANAQDEHAVREAFDAEDVEAERREIYLYDTLGLDLFEAGVVLRARLVRDGADDSTVKLRPVVPERLSDEWKQTEGFEVELDAVGDQAICLAKLTVEQDRGEIREVAGGERAIRKLFSEEQERLLAEFDPGDVGWDELSVLGPVDVRKWKVEPDGFPYEVTIEEWVLPDRSDLVELSVKVEPGDAAEARAALTELLTEKDLDPEGDPQTKTRIALRYFAGLAGISESP